MTTRMPDVVKTNGPRSLRIALACALLVVFAGTPLHAQSYQDLYDFNCAACTPYGRLTQGSDGNLYGTTTFGGSNNFGTIFLVSTTGTGYTTLWSFDGTNTGEFPSGGLTLSSFDGNFYGTTTDGGAFGYGTLFRFNPTTLVVTPVHQFSSTEFRPTGPPVESKHQNLYGMTSTNPGTAYRLTVATETFQILPNTVPNQPSGGPLFLASDGNFYGTTVATGASDGTVFGMTEGGAIKTVYKFTVGDAGIGPNAPLAQGKGAYDGYLFGTAYSGGGTEGELNTGTVFQLTLPPPVPSTEATLYTFQTTGGYTPDAGLLAASDGNLYGTTRYGGADNVGTLFEISPGGTFTPLDDFTGVGGLVSGANPNTTLMEDTNGLFYALTPEGGANGDGVFYSLTPPNPLGHISLCCNWWVVLDQPVTIIGQNLTGVISVDFGSVPARFQPGSDTYLIAEVPSAAIDSPITVTLATGLQLESQQNARILPKITNLDPSSGSVGTPVDIVGGGFAATKEVTFGGVVTGNFTVVSPALIQATVPAGAKTGKIGVITPNGTAMSKQTFTVN
jgi:uncharacterized repeat protein (TIGR03803 family)